jgi:PAS domain S-box-containing protein
MDIKTNKNEDKPKEAGDQFKLITENIQDVIWTLDLSSGLFNYVSPSIEYLLGFTPEEARGQTIKDVLTEGSYAYIMEELPKRQHAFEEGDISAQNNKVEIDQNHKNGSIIKTEVVTTFIKDESGKVGKVLGITRDITERKKAEEALRANEERQRALIDAIPDLLFRVSRDGVFLDYKAKTGEQLYASPELFLGKKITDVLPPETADLCMSELRMAFEYKKLRTFAYNLNIKNKTLFFEARASANIEGNEAVFIIRDVTEQTLLDVQLQREHDFAVQILESMSDAFIALDKNWRYTYVNKKTGAIFNREPGQLIGKHIWTESHEGIGQHFQKACERAMEQQSNITIEEYYAPYNKWFENYINATDEGLLVFFRDITGRKDIELHIENERIRLRTLIETIPDMVWLKDTNGVFLACNPVFAKRIGLNKEDIIGKSDYDIEPKERADNSRAKDNAALDSNKAITFLEEISFKETGTSGLFETIKKPVYDATGKLMGVLGISRDVTKLQEANRALKESERKLKEAQQIAKIGYWDYNLITKSISWSDTIYEILEIDQSKNPASYETFQKAIHPEDRERARNAYLDSVQTKRPYSINFRLVMKDGRIKYVSEKCVTEYDNDGNQVRSLSTVQDITEIQKSHEIITRLSLAMEQTTDAVFITNKEGVIEYTNNSLEQIYGYHKDELIGQNPRIFKSGIKDDNFYKTLWDTILIGESFRAEVINKSKNGIYIYDDQIITPLKDANGNVTHFLSISRDITERKLSELQFAKNERRFSNILQTAIDGFLIINDKGRLVEVNEAYCKMSGYSRKELLTMHLRDVEAVESNEEIAIHIQRILKSGREQFESIHKRKDGTCYPIESSVMINEFNGLNIIAFIRDITEQKKLVAELTKAKETAETLNRLKSVFLANMSHELRTPLVGIIGFTEILSESVDDPALKEMTSVIDSSAHRLQRTLDLILELTLLESNEEEIKLLKLDAVGIVKECLTFFEQQASEKNLTLMLQPGPEHVVIDADRRILTTIVHNLIDNAIKFTIKGSITIMVSEESAQDVSKCVRIAISDTGIGMSEDALKIIFEEFRQASEGLSRQYEGTGLGLTISRRYVELLHGTISVVSKLGEGSTFTVEIPISESPSENEKKNVL